MRRRAILATLCLSLVSVQAAPSTYGREARVSSTDLNVPVFSRDIRRASAFNRASFCQHAGAGRERRPAGQAGPHGLRTGPQKDPDMSRLGGSLKKFQAVKQQGGAGKPENPNAGKPEIGLKFHSYHRA